jgi:nicotinamide riboside transporter PnuC
MILAILTILVGLSLGFGGMQELIVRGIIGHEVYPGILGIIGTVIAVLFIVSGIAMWRKWPNTRRLVIVTSIFSIVFHVYAALPPYRNVGPPALIVGAGFGLVLLIVTRRSRPKTAAPAVV